MTTGQTMTIDDALPKILEALHTNGFPLDGGERQMLNLAEEAGEFIGAYRRYVGKARREGTFKEVALELADVLITARVTAAELGITLRSVRSEVNDPLGLFTAVARVVRVWSGGGYDDTTRAQLDANLGLVVARCYLVAERLEIDLDQAVSTKLEKIFTRGWNDRR